MKKQLHIELVKPAITEYNYILSLGNLNDF